MNYTDRETPYTRSIEHKHFEFGERPLSSTYVTKKNISEIGIPAKRLLSGQ